MRSETLENPREVLERLVAAGVEVIRARDFGVAAALDVAPPSIEGTHQPAPRSTEGRGLAYRAARKVYRKLKDNQQLRPLLDRVRHEILTRT